MIKFIPILFVLVLVLSLGVVAAATEREGELEFSYQEEVTVSPGEVNAPGVTSVVQAAYTWQPSSSPTDDVGEDTVKSLEKMKEESHPKKYKEVRR